MSFESRAGFEPITPAAEPIAGLGVSQTDIALNFLLVFEEVVGPFSIESSWTIGRTVQGSNFGEDGSGNTFNVQSDLVLVSITPLATTVPEPSAVLLLGAGLLALAVRKLRN